MRVRPDEEQTIKGKRFSEEHLIAVLKESEASAKTNEVRRRHRISEATLYNWKATYAGGDGVGGATVRVLRD